MQASKTQSQGRIENCDRGWLAGMAEVLAGSLLAGSAMGQGPAADQAPRYGAADFCPSVERPAGYRGDGSGVYPAATPPLSFSEQGKTNLLWVTKIPKVWSHSPPLVAGKRVFIEGEPDTTLCLDADTGKILWQDSLDLLETPTGGWALHAGNGYSTASSDGAAIYRLFSGKPKEAGKKGTCLLASYDLGGKRRWLAQTTGFGSLSTPLLLGNRYILGGTGYDTATGKIAWGPMKYDVDPGEPKPWSGGNNNDDSLVGIRLNGQGVAVYPGGWCVDPRTGKLMAKVLAMRNANGRAWHPMGVAMGPFFSPVARANADGSATILFSGQDEKGLVVGPNKEPAVPIPPDADLKQAPWADKKTTAALRVLACRLTLDGSGQIRSEPLWKEPATLLIAQSSHPWPHLSLCGDRIAVSHVKGQLAVLDLKTGRLLGKDFQPVYNCEYKTGASKYKWDAPELVAAREEYGLTEEIAFGKGGGRNMETSVARMARAVYARTAVDSRNHLWLANRWGEVYVLELNDRGFRQVALNRVNQPICWCSHAAPVFQGNRVYYRTWGHLYCFEGM